MLKGWANDPGILWLYVCRAFVVFGILHIVTLKDHSLKSLSFQLEVFVIFITNSIAFVADFYYQSLKHWFTCDNESFSNRRGSFIYKMSSEAHTWAVIFNSCLPISNHDHMAKKVYLLRKLRTQCLIVKQAIKQLLWKPVNFTTLMQPLTSIQHTFNHAISSCCNFI